MRPLPDLTDLEPSTSVYQAPADDFLQLFGADLTEYDSLFGALDQQATSTIASGPGIDSAIGALDGSLGEAISIFDTLSAADQAIDLSSAIADALSLDSALASNLDSWAPDIGYLAAGFIGQLFGFINDDFNAFLEQVIPQIEDEITAQVELFVEQYLSGLQ